MKELRDLAKEYAQNIIDKDHYRNSRKELLKAIVANEFEVKEHEYLAPLESFSEDLDETTENIITQFSPPPTGNLDTPPIKTTEQQNNQATGILRQKYIFISMATVIILCVITLLILSFPDTENAPPENADEKIFQTSAGQNLIIGFIQQNNWSQENLDSFTTSWQQLSDQELSVAATSPEMKRLTNTIYQQLLDERALISLGDVENADANQHKLVDFSKQLGISDERLSVYEPDPDAHNTETYIEKEIDQTDITNTLKKKSLN